MKVIFIGIFSLMDILFFKSCQASKLLFTFLSVVLFLYYMLRWVSSNNAWLLICCTTAINKFIKYSSFCFKDLWCARAFNCYGYIYNICLYNSRNCFWISLVTTFHFTLFRSDVVGIVREYLLFYLMSVYILTSVYNVFFFYFR